MSVLMSPHCLCHALPLLLNPSPKKQIFLEMKRIQVYDLPECRGADVIKKRRTGVLLFLGWDFPSAASFKKRERKRE